MLRVPIGVLALLLLAPALWALDDPKDAKKPDAPPPKKAQTPAEELQAIKAEYVKEQQEWTQSYMKATPEERQKLLANRPTAQKFAKRMFELAEKNPKDVAAGDALAWVVQNLRSGPEADKALGLLLRNHLDSKELGNICQSLRYSGSADTEKNLRAILEKSPHHDVQGQACLALAQYLKDKSPKTATPEVEELLARVVKDFSDVKLYQRSIGTMAKGELFEMQHLAVGMEAPEIAGEDIDGKSFKLSEYRGKVVLLDFWGNW